MEPKLAEEQRDFYIRKYDEAKQEVHHHHHSEPVKPTVNLSAEKNSRGVNWSATVIGAGSVEEGMELLKKAQDELERRFGTIQVVG